MNFLRIQYQHFNPNQNFKIQLEHWLDLGGAQIVGSTGIQHQVIMVDSGTLYPIFKDITKIVVKNDGTVSVPNLSWINN